MAFTVVSNAEPVSRQGNITVGDKAVAIAQEAAPCTFSVNPTRDAVTSAGERKTISVTASGQQCSWTARSDVDWLTIVGNAQGTGNGQVIYEARATTGQSRTGTLLVAGQVVTVTQGEGCTTALSPSGQTVPARGGAGNISVATGAGCPWTAQSAAGWISISSGQTGAGPGTVGFTVGAWDGPARSGTITVNGQAFTVAQESGCTYTIDPSSQPIAAAGGSGAVNVHSAAGCPWTAQSGAGWISISSGQTGAGPGTVGFTVGAWDGPARSGTITINGQVFTVAQESGCRYTIDPLSQAIAAAGGSGAVNVHSAAGCGWNANSNAPWITISSGATGSGEGRVQFTVAASTGPARSGTLSIAGRTFTVDQASGCSYALVPSSSNVADAAGTGSFAVNTADGCSWSATSNTTSWLTIVGPSTGSGNGTVTYQYSANAMGGYPRTGTISVNGQTFTVNQAAGVPCVYVLSPVSMDVSAAAGSGGFSVQTVLTCPWTAVSNAPWIAIVGPPGGAGNGAVNFSYAENPPGSPARSGTITVNGQTFTVNQAAGPGG